MGLPEASGPLAIVSIGYRWVPRPTPGQGTAVGKISRAHVLGHSLSLAMLSKTTISFLVLRFLYNSSLLFTHAGQSIFIYHPSTSALHKNFGYLLEYLFPCLLFPLSAPNLLNHLSISLFPQPCRCQGASYLRASPTITRMDRKM